MDGLLRTLEQTHRHIAQQREGGGHLFDSRSSQTSVGSHCHGGCMLRAAAARARWACKHVGRCVRCCCCCCARDRTVCAGEKNAAISQQEQAIRHVCVIGGVAVPACSTWVSSRD
jgi:hypothetical protein